jgi:phosphoribosyl 1,2-cyclic phosphate phosphodiesterase
MYIETEKVKLVIDTGPDFRQQMLRERVEWIDAVLFTHAHKDHTAGLDDIRSFNFKQKMDIPIYGREEVLQQLKKEFSYIFSDHKYPGVPRVQVQPIENEPFKVNAEEIVPIEVLHYKLKVHGFRIQDFSYITDANFIAEDQLEKLKGTKILVLNALQKTPHLSHFTLQEALELIEKLQPELALLTHISHKMGKHRDVSRELPDNVFIAQDGLTLDTASEIRLIR